MISRWLRRDGDAGGGASSSALSGVDDAGIAIDVLLGHAFDGEAFAGGGAAGFGIDFVGVLDRVGHFFDRIHKETGAAVINEAGQCSKSKRNDWCAAGERFHGHERTGFRNRAWNEQAARAAKCAEFAAAIERADPAAEAIFARANLLIEIAQVRFVGERCAAEKKWNASETRGVHGEVVAFFGTNAAETERVIAAPDGNGRRNFNAIFDRREEILGGRTTEMLHQRNAMEEDAIHPVNVVGVEIGRKVESGENWNIAGGEVFAEIDAVQVDDVDGETVECFGNFRAVQGVLFCADVTGESGGRAAAFEECAANTRATGGNDD